MSTNFPLTSSSITLGVDVPGTDSELTHVVTKSTISEEFVSATGIGFSPSVLPPIVNKVPRTVPAVILLYSSPFVKAEQTEEWLVPQCFPWGRRHNGNHPR